MSNHANGTRLINVRKLAALDIAFHGVKVILVEFLIGTFLSAALSAFVLFLTARRSFSSVLLGLYLLGIAVNYAVLLLYAVFIRSRERAVREVEAEMSDTSGAGCQYTVQSIVFILIPFALTLLALYQLIVPRRTE